MTLFAIDFKTPHIYIKFYLKILVVLVMQSEDSGVKIYPTLVIQGLRNFNILFNN